MRLPQHPSVRLLKQLLFFLPLITFGLIVPPPSAQAVTPVPSGITVHIERTIGPMLPSDESNAALEGVPTTKGRWKATWDLATGRVSSLYGGEMPAFGPLDAAARGVLAANGALFGLGDTSDLKVTETLSVMLGEVIRYQQTWKGLKVFPGDVSVSRNPSGRIFHAASGYRPGVNLNTTPILSVETAKAYALNIAGGRRVVGAELMIWAERAPYRLAWEIQALVRPDLTEWVILDATDGSLLRKGEKRSYADPLGDVYLKNPVATPRTSAAPFTSLNGSGSLDGQFVNVKKFSKYDAQGNTQGEFDLKATAEGFRIPANDPRMNQNMMYFHVTRYHDFFKNTFNFTQWDKSMPAFVAVTDEKGGALNNAYFSPGCKCITFGSTSSGTDLALDADVIGHEYTHAIVNELAGIGQSLDRWAEARALNEAIADYFSSTVAGEGCLGEYAGGPEHGGCNRYLTNRKRYPDEVAQSVNLKDGSTVYAFPEEHYTGEIWGAALWDLRRSMGATLADKIIFGSLPLLKKEATFADARAALITTDGQLGTGQGALIAQLMTSRGIPEPAAATAYVGPFDLSHGNDKVVGIGYLSPDGGPFNPQGFLPVFVKGRDYVFQGLLDGFGEPKKVALIFTDPAGKVIQSFGANIAQVQTQKNTGPATVTRFQVLARITNDMDGAYQIGIGVSADGSNNFSMPNAVAAKVVAPGGAVPEPPGEVISNPTPNPGPGPVPPTVPVTPASITVQPEGATVTVGRRKTFTATVIDTKGVTLQHAPVNWSVEGDAGTISPNGIFQAQRAGTASIVGKVGAVEGRVTLTVSGGVQPANVNAWQLIAGSEKQNILSLSASAAAGKSYLFGTSPAGLAVSGDRQAFQGIFGNTDPNTIPWAVAANPQAPGTLYVGFPYDGLFRTDDWKNWSQYAEDLLAYSQSLGQNGYPLITSLTTRADDLLLVGTLNMGAFYRQGPTQPWFVLNEGMSTATIYSMAVSATSTLFAGTSTGAFRIRNNDSKWTSINNGLQGSNIENQNAGLPPTVAQIVVDPQNPMRILAATYGDGVFLSTNEGDSWTAMNTGLTSTKLLTIAVDPATPNRFFVGSDGEGVFVSTDGAAHWQPARAGLTIGVVNSLVFDVGNPQYLYAGTGGEGVFSLDLNGTVVNETASATPLYGDLNGDRKVNVSDAILFLRSLVGLVQLTEDQKVVAEVNGDGAINVSDAVEILRITVGI